MGFFSRAKDVGGYIVNLRVKRWLGYDQVKSSYVKLAHITGDVLRPEQAERSESFEEALQRLNLSQNELEQRVIEFTRLMITYLLAATAIFSYSVWIVLKYKNIYGFFMGLSITIYALTFAFRYHFWIFQIKNKKLGCTLRDWFLDKR